MDCGTCHDCVECCLAWHAQEANANCSFCQQNADEAYWNWVENEIDAAKEREHEKQL